MRRILVALLVLASLGGLATGCARNRGPFVPPAVSEPAATNDRDAYERQLTTLVERRVADATRESAARQQEVIRKSPYYYREYTSYPQGATPVEIEFTETESRSKPLTASVKLEMIRYSTKLQRDQNTAARDTNFYRDTGIETQEYILRNNRWVSVGDTFVAETSEENVGGSWVPVRVEETEVPQIKESEGGWFKRTWRNITGG
ncbi:MAG: hypothetical protein GC168_04460 [Candidatus Hydrogenedens sp.]|nr:hypothetical protein [Candidatus Hydrogenedens sp.]